MLIVVNPSQRINKEQVRQINRSVQGALKEAGCRGAVLVSNGDVHLAAVPPYTFREEAGGHAYQWGFPTQLEMVLFRLKTTDGLWYDWDANESNDPRWAALSLRPRCVDKGTGETVPRVLFYHAGVKQCIRVACGANDEVDVGDHTAVPTIFETRELEICVAPAKV